MVIRVTITAEFPDDFEPGNLEKCLKYCCPLETGSSRSCENWSDYYEACPMTEKMGRFGRG